MAIEPDIMTWFPRKEDYEVAPTVALDETYEEKLTRLSENIEATQSNIKEVVDGDNVTNEHKIYRTMDVRQDLESLTKLHKECESDGEASKNAELLKKCKVGLINLQSYLNQVDVVQFAQAIRNEFQFKVGCTEGFGPWLEEAERRVIDGIDKPNSFDHAREVEKQTCVFLKEVVKANKKLKQVQEAAEGIKGDVNVQDVMAKLSERYFVLCKKSEQRVKNVQNLIVEWQKLNEYLEPTNPFDMDDYQTKQFVIFLRCYASNFA